MNEVLQMVYIAMLVILTGSVVYDGATKQGSCKVDSSVGALFNSP